MTIDLIILVGWIMVIGSIFDAWKYVIQAKAIKRAKTARGVSRMFLNIAIIIDIIKIAYGALKLDPYIFISALFAIVTMCYCYWILYLYYPYKLRKVFNFKRPNLLVYIINSFQPNGKRKRL